MKFKGGHLEEVWELLQKEKYVEIISQEKLPGGLILNRIKNLATGEIFSKTVFCKLRWTQEKINRAILEIYQNPIRDVLSKDNTSILREGIYEGIIMHIACQYHAAQQEKAVDFINVKSFLPYPIPVKKVL